MWDGFFEGVMIRVLCDGIEGSSCVARIMYHSSVILCYTFDSPYSQGHAASVLEASSEMWAMGGAVRCLIMRYTVLRRRLAYVPCWIHFQGTWALGRFE